MKLPKTNNRGAAALNTNIPSAPPAYFESESDTSHSRCSDSLPNYTYTTTDVSLRKLRAPAKSRNGHNLAQQRLDGNFSTNPPHERVLDYVDAHSHLDFPALPGPIHGHALPATADIEAQTQPNAPEIQYAQPSPVIPKRTSLTLIVATLLIIPLIVWVDKCIYERFAVHHDFCTNYLWGQWVFFGIPLLVLLWCMLLIRCATITGRVRNAKGKMVTVIDKGRESILVAWWFLLGFLLCVGLLIVRLGCREEWYGDDTGFVFGAQ